MKAQKNDKVIEAKKLTLPPVISVLLAVLLWSTGGLFIKLTTLNAFAVNAGRSLVAAIVVALFTYRKGLCLDRFTLLMSLLYASTLSCFVYATKATYAANAIFLQYTAPVYVLILSPLILKEKFHSSDIVTVLLCLAGMSLFFLEGDVRAETAPNVFAGNIAALLSGVFFGLYFILLRHPLSLKNQNPAISVFYGNLIAVFLMLPFVLQDLPSLNINDVLAILFLGAFQIGLAYILFTNGVANGVRPLDASIIGFIEPLLNPVWVFLFLGEIPSRWAILGGMIILGTVIMHTIKMNKKPKTVTTASEPLK